MKHALRDGTEILGARGWWCGLYWAFPFDSVARPYNDRDDVRRDLIVTRSLPVELLSKEVVTTPPRPLRVHRKHMPPASGQSPRNVR